MKGKADLRPFSHPSAKQNSSDRRWLICVIFFVCLCICLAVVFTLNTSICDTKAREDINIGRYGLCLPCNNDLVQTFSEEAWQMQGKRGNVCCLQDADNIIALFKIDKLRLYSRDAFSHGVSFGPRPAVHTFIDPYKLYVDKVIVWTIESPTAFKTENMRLGNGSITVPVGGHYYVYSFLTYKSEHLASPEMINHYVYRENKHLPRTSRQVVLTDKQMRLTGHLTYQRSFLSSALKLSKDDTISVNVTNITALYPLAMANFLGLFYIGP